MADGIMSQTISFSSTGSTSLVQGIYSMSNFLDFDVVEHYTCAHFLGAYNFNWMI